MIPLLAVLILLLTPLVMLSIRVVRPRFAYFWLVAVSGAAMAWPLIFFSRPAEPQIIPIVLRLAPSTILAPTFLLLDSISWSFAFSLATLALATILTAVVRFTVGWRAWSGALFLTGLGIFTVLAGNPLVLIFGWATLDLVEILILLLLINESQTRERIVVTFSARLAGIVLLVWATLIGQNNGADLSFSAIPPEASIFLLLAAGLRLGVIPLHVPFLQEPPLRRGIGTVLRLVPAAASLLLLTRTALVGVPLETQPYLLLLVGIASIFGAWNWATAENELAGRPFWIVGMASLAVASAIRAQPAATLAWSLALVLPGAMIFLASTRHRNLLFILGLGFLGTTALPFTPVWSGTGLYAGLVEPLTLLFIPAHILLMAGYARFSISSGETPTNVERYVWAIYPLGLGLLFLAHFILGLVYLPALDSVPLISWLVGPLAVVVAVVIWGYSRSYTFPTSQVASLGKRFFSLTWFYQLLWTLFRFVGRMVATLTALLEGEAGVLWALVLLALLLSVMTQQIAGG